MKVGLLKNVYQKKGNNLYVKNLSPVVDEMTLLQEFERFGAVSSVHIAMDDKGKSRGFGFVFFVNQEDAERAANETNGKEIVDKAVNIFFAQKKYDREAFIAAKNFGFINLGGTSPGLAVIRPNLHLRLRLAKEGKKVAQTLLEQNSIEFCPQARNTGAIPKSRTTSTSSQFSNLFSRKENTPVADLETKLANLQTPTRGVQDGMLSTVIRHNLEKNFPKYLDRLMQAFALYDSETLKTFAKDSNMLFEAAFAEINQMNRSPVNGHNPFQ